jgi:hypothetical protein
MYGGNKYNLRSTSYEITTQAQISAADLTATSACQAKYTYHISTTDADCVKYGYTSIWNYTVPELGYGGGFPSGWYMLGGTKYYIQVDIPQQSDFNPANYLDISGATSTTCDTIYLYVTKCGGGDGVIKASTSQNLTAGIVVKSDNNNFYTITSNTPASGPASSGTVVEEGSCPS